MVGRSEDAIRLTIVDALILQSFRPDYPVQGKKTKQFEQIGNAIPPLLAWHRVRVGGRAANGGGSATYWSRKLAPKRFVRRGADAWRVA
jgi:hypothetical protein